MRELVLEVDPPASTLNKLILEHRARNDRDRPKGLHLSTILDDKFSMLKTYRPMEPEASVGYQEIGCMFEDVAADLFRRKFTNWKKPEPKQYRGVWCSPDGFDGAVLDEMKATWVSSKDFLVTTSGGRPITKSLKWLRYEWQVLSYMKAFGVQRARLHVWFVGGKWGFQPGLPRTFLMKYSQQAIDENWRRVVQHGVDRGMLKAA